VNLPLAWLRFAGLLLLITCLGFYDPDTGNMLHRLLIPLLMALAAWAMVQNLAAVALGTAVLATIHSDLSADSWIDRLAYPALAAMSSLALLTVAGLRFRRRIHETHDARWTARRPDE